MCNAWNHPPDCSCGWGGEGYVGRRSFHSHLNGWIPPLQPTYESFTRPNAACPVCGGSVFFYQSVAGGRVFFDELGPPWPKHPCTDNSSVPNQVGNTMRSRVVGSARWKQDGWEPIQLRFETEIDRFFSKIVGVWCNKELELFLRKNALVRFGARARVHTSTIAHLREYRDSIFEL